MATQNDEVILGLKKEIEEKKKLLNKESKFNPITNCSILLDGSRYNIHALNKEGILLLIAKLKSLETALKAVMPEEKLVIEGYGVEDWLTDLRAKFEILNVSNEKTRLQKLEQKLHTLLSIDKKVELEIEDLKNQI